MSKKKIDSSKDMVTLDITLDRVRVTVENGSEKEVLSRVQSAIIEEIAKKMPRFSYLFVNAEALTQETAMPGMLVEEISNSKNKGTSINKRDAFRLLYEDEINYYLDNIEYQGKLKDISAIGLSFKSNVLHKLGSLLIFDSSTKELNVIGKIVRVEETGKSDFQYSYGVSIIDKDISCFVFRKQAELIRKGRNIR